MSISPSENSNRLKIAIQKSGRLSEKSLELLKECGIQITTSPNALRAEASNFPLEILFLRDDDIPEYVQDGVADVGIIGENVMLEKGKKLELINRLGFAKCRLSLAVPEEQRIMMFLFLMENVLLRLIQKFWQNISKKKMSKLKFT